MDRTFRTHPLISINNERHKDLTTTHYELTNHLGNVLSTVTGRKLGQEGGTPGEVGHYLPEVVTTTDYYPFGQPMPGRQFQNPAFSETNSYRYGFNGKELDSDGEFGSLTHYDYGFRIYNPAIGKFLSVDPLTKDYPWYTPYQFAGNKPIWAIDLDGLEESLAIRQRHRDKAYTDGTKSQEEIMSEYKAEGVGALLGLGLLIDCFNGFNITKGAYATQAASLLYHNSSKDEQTNEQRSKEGKDFVAYSTLGIGLGKTVKIVQNINFTNSTASVSTEVTSNAGKGVLAPKGWITKKSDKGGGVKFVDPNNPHNNIRQMPGNPNSPNPAQQNPYVIFKKDGVAYDVNGMPLKSATDPASHIPQDKFDINKMPIFD